MTLKELLDLAARGYDAEPTWGDLTSFYDPVTGEPYPYDAVSGDSLAHFIAIELAETFDPEAGTGVQIAEALRVMERARDDVDRVVLALREGQPAVA